MIDQMTILSAIGSTENSSFSEFCSALGADMPAKGDRAGWRELFTAIEQAERDGLLQIRRNAEKHIDTLMLTEAGAARVRELKDSERPLLPRWES